MNSFLESLWRDIDMNRLHMNPTHELNFVIVSHGEIRVMELGQGGDYSLAIHHTEEELERWGLSPEMIADQKWRVNAHKGEWKEDCKWYFGDFFDHMADSDQESETDATEEDKLNLLTNSEDSNEELCNVQCS
ncbi:hypothetical protein DY000_02043876 [Brassica cretica]|uniref:Uncharacterized protein n=1 Tax=Brassica cretica TaxID=69181 RepID=A0ABQ7BHR4_BRACR|nr:hypothetical protein DY000_02043876 [Brassica cretica]